MSSAELPNSGFSSIVAIMNVDLNPKTAKLIADFAEALSDKLQAAEERYGYTDGWANSDWMDECRAKLREHLEKGDPRDVAAYCAFLWWHKESTALPISQRNAEQSKDYTLRERIEQAWKNWEADDPEMMRSVVRRVLREALDETQQAQDES